MGNVGSNLNESFSLNLKNLGNILSLTYLSGNGLTFGSSGGDVQLNGIATINAATRLGAPLVIGDVGSFSTINVSTIRTQNLNVSTITAVIGTFSDLFINNPKIHLGSNTGVSGQGNFTVAIGDGAGQTTQGLEAVAVGSDAGNATQGAGAVAIGVNAGSGGQGTFAVAVGANSGFSSQDPYSVAIGTGAGNVNLGSNSIAIGTSASANGSNLPNTLVLNATGLTLNPITSTSCYMAPMRGIQSSNAYQTSAMLYNATTSEITYDSAFYGITVVATSGTAIVLDASMRGRIYILTGTTTQAFTTSGLNANDTNFFITCKNGNGVNGGDITITGATGSLIVHEAKPTQNSGIIILRWNGSALISY